MLFRKSNICSHKLHVQDANVSISQFHHRIGSHFVGCWFANGRVPVLDLQDVVMGLLDSSKI